jgi:hypothetical protein
MGGRRTLRLALAALVGVIALPGNSFVRGQYEWGWADSPDEQEWACEHWPNCRSVVTDEERQMGARCSRHRRSGRFIVPVVQVG